MPNETDGKLRRTFGRPLGKRTRIALIVLVSLLSLFVAFQLAAPFLVSTVLVRERMERAVEEWIGHDVSIGGQPSLAFWPEPRITFSDVMVRNIDHGKKGMLGSVRELSASFDLLGALVGQPEFKDFHLKDPQLFVLRKPDGRRSAMSWPSRMTPNLTLTSSSVSSSESRTRFMSNRTKSAIP